MSKDAEVGLKVLGVSTSAAAAEAQHQVKRGFLLDVVVGESAAILQLLPREDEALLVRRDTYRKTETSTISPSLKYIQREMINQSGPCTSYRRLPQKNKQADPNLSNLG